MYHTFLELFHVCLTTDRGWIDAWDDCTDHARGEECSVGIADVDFGDFGSSNCHCSRNWGAALQPYLYIPPLN